MILNKFKYAMAYIAALLAMGFLIVGLTTQCDAQSKVDTVEYSYIADARGVLVADGIDRFKLDACEKTPTTVTLEPGLIVIQYKTPTVTAYDSLKVVNMTDDKKFLIVVSDKRKYYKVGITKGAMLLQDDRSNLLILTDLPCN